MFRPALITTALMATACVAAPKTMDAPPPLRIDTIAEFPPGTFLENLIVINEDEVLFTNYFEKKLMRLHSGGELTTFANLPDHPVGLLQTEEGYIVSAHGTPFSDSPAFMSTNKILFLSPDGTLIRTAETPRARFLNGLHQLAEGTILVADSVRGVVWSIEVETGALTLWLEDERLTSDPHAKTFRPAANGIKSRDGAVYISNSSRGAIYRRSPGSSGNLVEYAKTGPVDDFVIDSDGTIYATTHGNALLKIDPTRAIAPVFENGCDGCTSVAFRRDGDYRTLVVLTTGGLLEGHSAPARVLRVTGY